jgi:3-phosphoshikimate 1-carboxyvinyltransferase
MEFFVIKPQARFNARLSLPGDKSITHRALILSAISSGKVKISNLPDSDDCLWTIKALRALGVEISIKGKTAVVVMGRGLRGLTKPPSPVFCGESGTTLRLLCGVLAGQNFETVIKAAPSLSRRPMRRIIVPLRMMGARIISKSQVPSSKSQTTKEEYPPLTIYGGNLRSITYEMPVASAQVKSAILLAGLFASGRTCVKERTATRDHTERMFKLFKAEIKHQGRSIVIKGGGKLVSPKMITVPGDISSAAFFMVLAAITADSRIDLRDISLNSSRLGIVKVLKRMGADIKVTKSQNQEVVGVEQAGDIVVKSSSLRGVRISGREIPSLIDEIPILMVAAAFAKGATVFENVSELRVKETDRIRSMSENLRKMGAAVSIINKGKLEQIVVRGVGELKGARVRSFSDHRTAMSMVVAGMAAKGQTRIDDVSCISKSFPGFLSLLRKIKK